MNVGKPVQVGISEKATNNPPIEILIQNAATLAHLPKTWPVGTVAYTPGRENQWKFNAAGGWDAVAKPDFNIDTPASGDTLVYDSEAGAWGNDTRVLLLTTSTVESDTVLSEKWSDILAAYVAGKPVILYSSTDKAAYGLLACYKSVGNYIVEISAAAGTVATYSADAENKKPVLQVAG